MFRCFFSASACSLALCAHVVMAETRINGFSTLAVGTAINVEEEASFFGYDEDITFARDSLFSLQVRSDLGENLEATVQMKSLGQNDWDVEFEWAYIGYQFNKNVKLLVGRQRTPYYIYSDYVDVGYTYHWITPPRGFYQAPFDSTNGVSLLINNTLGYVESNFQILIGRDQTEALFLSSPSPVDAQLFSLNWSLNYDFITFRIGHTETEITADIDILNQANEGWRQLSAQTLQASALLPNPQLAGLLGAAATQMSAIPDQLAWDGDKLGFTGVGLMLDFSKFLFITEYSFFDADGTYFGELVSSYVSLGYRINDILMISATAGKDDDQPPKELIENLPRDITAGLIPELDVGLNTLLDVTNTLFASVEQERDYYQVTFRWDFHPSAAFKVDYRKFDDLNNDVFDADFVRTAISIIF